MKRDLAIPDDLTIPTFLRRIESAENRAEKARITKEMWPALRVAMRNQHRTPAGTNGAALTNGKEPAMTQKIGPKEQALRTAKAEGKKAAKDLKAAMAWRGPKPTSDAKVAADLAKLTGVVEKAVEKDLPSGTKAAVSGRQVTVEKSPAAMAFGDGIAASQAAFDKAKAAAPAPAKPKPPAKAPAKAKASPPAGAKAPAKGVAAPKAKAAPKPANKPAAKPAPGTRKDGLREGSKQAIMLDMALRKEGATEEAICKKLGWKRCRVTLRRVAEKVGAKLESRKVNDATTYFAKL